MATESIPFTTSNTNLSNLIQCNSCGLSYDSLIGHACPSGIPASIGTTTVTIGGNYCSHCGELWTNDHLCDPPSRHPILGLEQRYIFRMEDLV